LPSNPSVTGRHPPWRRACLNNTRAVNTNDKGWRSVALRMNGGDRPELGITNPCQPLLRCLAKRQRRLRLGGRTKPIRAPNCWLTTETPFAPRSHPYHHTVRVSVHVFISWCVYVIRLLPTSTGLYLLHRRAIPKRQAQLLV
jgi:hypothetical protein